MLDSKILENLFYYSHTKALLLLILFIVFGRLFIVNLKDKENDWKRKAWFYGIVSLLSFTFLVFMPIDK